MRGINNEIIRYFISRRNVVGVGLSVKKKQNRERKCLVIFVEKKSEEEQLAGLAKLLAIYEKLAKK